MVSPSVVPTEVVPGPEVVLVVADELVVVSVSVSVPVDPAEVPSSDEQASARARVIRKGEAGLRGMPGG